VRQRQKQRATEHTTNSFFFFEENSLSTVFPKGDLHIVRERETRTPFRDNNNSNNNSDGRERRQRTLL
jgi:hypothetical protein